MIVASNENGATLRYHVTALSTAGTKTRKRGTRVVHAEGRERTRGSAGGREGGDRGLREKRTGGRARVGASENGCARNRARNTHLTDVAPHYYFADTDDSILVRRCCCTAAHGVTATVRFYLVRRVTRFGTKNTKESRRTRRYAETEVPRYFGTIKFCSAKNARVLYSLFSLSVSCRSHTVSFSLTACPT